MWTPPKTIQLIVNWQGPSDRRNMVSIVSRALIQASGEPGVKNIREIHWVPKFIKP